MIIFSIIGFITMLYGLYFIITDFLVFFPNKHKIGSFKPKNKFGILVAARNEEAVIGDLVDSLKVMDYPKKLYDIYVLPNNCSDDTEGVALKHGANILHCEVPVKSKGEVLREAFRQLKKKKIDAYIIFDADNVVDKNFLRKMNDTLESGYNVAQCNRDSKNIKDNWISAGYSLFYYVQNFFFNKSRMNIGANSAINGTGFMVRKSLIDEKGFPTVTLTEDNEFTALCALWGEKIAFVEEAITYDEQPIEFKVSWKQRKRWSTGTLQCLHKYGFSLIKTFWDTGRLACLDIFMRYMAVYMQIVSMIVATIGYVKAYISTFDVFGYKFTFDFSMLGSISLIAIIMYVASLLIMALILDYNHQNSPKLVFGLALFPLFMFTWLPINIVCVLKKQTTWEPIKHGRKMNTDAINNRNK